MVLDGGAQIWTMFIFSFDGGDEKLLILMKKEAMIVIIVRELQK